jgi:pimeloyl-ACP methyl ester carboxylesterase
MDYWDPLLINTLGAARPVILFDQAGVGRSTGEIPLTYQGWAEDVIVFVNTLGLVRIDLLGFSMGGRAVQMVALTVPQLVRKLILAGTSASEPDPSSSSKEGIVWPREIAPREPIRQLATATTPEEIEDALAYSFFYNDDQGRAAAKAYLNRVSERNIASEPRMVGFVDRDTGAKRQMAASKDWDKPNPQYSFHRLCELTMPVLVCNGDNDLLIPTSRSWEMVSRISNSQLVIYPHAGHGFLYQYAGLVARHINLFLDGTEFEDAISKL